MLSKFWARLRDLFSARDQAGPSWVRCGAEGREVLRDDRLLYVVKWDHVRQVFAYKDDVLAFDIICIGLRLDDSGEWRWIDEEMQGCDEALAELQRRFTGWPEDWWQSVAMPPFERCLTHLWGREFDWDAGSVKNND